MLAGANETADLELMWSHIEQLYYYRNYHNINNDNNNASKTTAYTTTGPVIIGMERCAEFRNKTGSNAKIGIAGLFNTGTNALFENLKANIGIPGNTNESYKEDKTCSHKDGIHRGVPWWKHNPLVDDPVRGRKPHQHDFLPIVLIRDPYFWRTSMCTSWYDLEWKGEKHKGCPEFWYSRKGIGQSGSIPSTDKVVFLNEIVGEVVYNSLVDVWNQFYSNYYHATFPRLIIRYEDTLFYLPKVLKAIQECAGGYFKNGDPNNTTGTTGQYYVMKQGAKNHGNAVIAGSKYGLVRSIYQTADPNLRVSTFTHVELEYTQRYLDRQLVEVFQYSLANPKDAILIKKKKISRK